jgi:uncharacterized membrane protein YbhN (UPF0104 family)
MARTAAARKGLVQKVVEIAFNLLGLYLLLHLMARIGFPTVAENLTRFGAGFLAIVGLALLWMLLQAWAWRLIQGRISDPVPLWAYFRVKLIADSLNTLLPSVNIGGDLARAHLIRSRIPLREGVPAVMVDKTIDLVSGAVFMGTGLVVGLIFLDLPVGIMIPGFVCLAAALAATTLMLLLLFTGLYRWLLAASAPFPPLRRFLVAREEKFLLLDSNLKAIFRRSRGRAFLSLQLYLVARMLGTFEIMIICAALGYPMGFVQTFFISALVTISNTIFFFVPGQWGVAEGAHVVALASLGFSGPVGLSLGVIRRIRKLATCVLGMGLYYLGRIRGTVGKAEIDTGTE